MFGASDKASKAPGQFRRLADLTRRPSLRTSDANGTSGLPNSSGYRERFAPRLLLLGLLAGTLVAMYFLYPKAYIENNLHTHPQPDATTLAYLRLLVRVEPHNEKLRLLLVREALAAGQLSLAKEAFAPWQHTPVSHLPLAVARTQLRIRLVAFQTASLNAVHRTALANAYVSDLMALAPRMRPEELLKKAKIVLALGRYDAAANVDRIAIRMSTSGRVRTTAFYDGIDALLAANNPTEALAFAQSEMRWLSPDERLWRVLTRLAISANQPVIAAEYARRLVGMSQ